MRGVIELDEGELDLHTTLQCGQTFCWHKVSGEPFFEDSSTEERYYTTREGEVIILWQEGPDLHFEASGDIPGDVGNLLRLKDDLDHIVDEIQKDLFMMVAVEAHRGIRLVKDPFAPTLTSFIIAQGWSMELAKRKFDALIERYGSALHYDGRSFWQPPMLSDLSGLSRADMDRLKIGFSGKRIMNAVERLTSLQLGSTELAEIGYDRAYRILTEIDGVKHKTANCVLLYSLGHLDAFPIDTWIDSALQKHYPELYEGGKQETVDNARAYFGQYAGYAQQYMFHHIRMLENAV